MPASTGAAWKRTNTTSSSACQSGGRHAFSPVRRLEARGRSSPAHATQGHCHLPATREPCSAPPYPYRKVEYSVWVQLTAVRVKEGEAKV